MKAYQAIWQAGWIPYLGGGLAGREHKSCYVHTCRRCCKEFKVSNIPWLYDQDCFGNMILLILVDQNEYQKLYLDMQVSWQGGGVCNTWIPICYGSFVKRMTFDCGRTASIFLFANELEGSFCRFQNKSRQWTKIFWCLFNACSFEWRRYAGFLLKLFECAWLSG